MNNDKRNYNLDLLRIVACFMVIVIHVAAQYWSITPYNSITFNIYNFYDSLVRAAVPIFVMISGVFFLPPKKKVDFKKLYFKNIFKLILIYVFWVSLYYIYSIIVYSLDFSFADFVHYFISGPVHVWYIPMIIGLYIISPLLCKITENSKANIFKYFFILFFLSCLLKTISYCNFIPHIDVINSFINKLPIDIFCQFYCYFLLGYFLQNYALSEKLEKAFYIVAVICVILCALLTCFSSKYCGYAYSSFYSEFSVFTFIEAVALFLFFKKTKFKSEQIYSNNVTYLSSCTLGIYLVHVMVMTTLFDFNIIDVTDFNPFFSVPTVSIIIFIISLIITILLKKVKLINKWLV